MAGDLLTECTVAEIAAPERNAIVGGPFGSELVSKDYVCAGVPVIRGANMGLGRWVAGVFAFVTAEKADSLAANCARPGDVVLTQRGTLGQVAIIPADGYDRYLISQSQMKVTVDPQKADSHFIYYFFSSPAQQEFIRTHAIQTGVPHTNLGILRRTPIQLPPLPEQKRIAHILGTLDDKIELNRRMNATLEGISRALFKSWFVDFDPVRQKAAGKQPVGMDAQTAALFPDSFEDSEIGEVPKGWGVGTVCDYGDLNPESWSRATYPDEVRYVDLSSTKWGEVEVVERHGRESAPSRAQRILRIGDTIFGTVRPGNGSFAFVEEDGLTGSTGFAVIRPKRREWREYVYVATTKAENVERLAHLADGGAYPAVRPEVVAATPIIDAPQEVVERFSDCTSACFTRIGENRRESRTLAALRDTLLPKLLSGEVRVPDAEEAVEEAVR